MKLHASVWYSYASSYDIASAFVHKQQNRCDKGGQALRKLGGALQCHGAWAGGVEHKADSICTGLNGGVYVLLTRQAADFDTGSVHGSQSKAAVRLGTPHWASYMGPRKYRPSGANVGAAASRERAASTSCIHCGGR